MHFVAFSSVVYVAGVIELPWKRMSAKQIDRDCGYCA